MKFEDKINIYGNSGHIAKSRIIYFRDYPDSFFEGIINYFQEKKILNNNFKDNKWEIYSQATSYYLPVEFNITPEFNKALKCYILLKMRIGRAASTVIGEYREIRHFIIASDYFTNINKYKINLEKKTLNNKSDNTRLPSVLLSFLNFYNDDSLREYVDYTSSFKLKSRQNRNLPHFNDVLNFDDIVNDFFKNTNFETHKRYLIIYMWWTITNIIPMRPSEFLSLSKNCLQYEEKSENPYRILVPRMKDKNSLTKEPREDLVYINIDIYNKISKAINVFLDIKSDSKYLFSIESHHKLSAPGSYTRKSKAERIYYSIFLDILTRFYEEIVIGTYQEYHHDRINLGDTRHFAIINMVLQGYNILSIAELAGHKSTKSAEAYYNHAETFAQSFVYKLSKNKLENILQSNIPDGLIGWKSYVISKGKLFKKDVKSNIVGKVNNYGLCTEEANIFPTTCIADCRLCDKFVFKPDDEYLNEGVVWLKDSSSQFEQRISEVINYMYELSVSVKKDKINDTNTALKTKANELNGLISMRALIESYLIGDESDG